MRYAINRVEVIEKKKNGCHRLSSPAISGYVSEMSTCQPPCNSLIKHLTILMTIVKIVIKILMQNVTHSYLIAARVKSMIHNSFTQAYKKRYFNEMFE